MTNLKNTEYFPHDMTAKDDPKMMIMMSQLGLEAYGIYWILVEYLRAQSEYKAPLILLDALSRRYGSSREKFEAVILNYSLFEHDDVNFWTPSLIRRMLPLDYKREKMKQLALKRWSDDTGAMRTHSEGTAQAMQSRVEKSRVKKSTVKKSKGEQSKENAALADLSFCDESFLSLWEEWLKFKNELKDPYKTQTGMKKEYAHLVNISGNDPAVARKIVEKSIRKEWKGLFPFDDKENTVPGEDPVQRIMNDIKKARAQ